MRRIAIVDDDMVFAEWVRSKVLESQWDGVMEADIFDCAKNFLYELEDGKRYDLCLSDVKMPEIDGLELAEKIRRIDSHMIFIFLSSYSRYAIRGYRVNAYDYIVKKQFEKEWGELLGRMKKELKDREKKIYLIEDANRFEKMWIEEIVYIYKEGKNAVFVIGDREIMERTSLKQVQDKLKEYRQFIMVERGYIVNIDQIRCVAQREIEMCNGYRIPVARLKLAEVREKIHFYYAGRI